MGFGALATVNGIGDFLSSAVGAQIVFAYSTVLFIVGAALVWRLE
jgi:hypothetical protein